MEDINAPIIYHCNILTSDPAVDQGTGASGRRYRGITLTVYRFNWVQMRRSQEAGVRKQLYNPGPQTGSVSWSQLVGDKML